MLLPLFMSAFAVLWVYCSGFLPVELRTMGIPRAAVEPTAFALTVVVFCFAPALPLAVMFRQWAWIVAASIGWIPLVMSFLLSEQSASFGARHLSLANGEAAGCWLAIVLGAKIGSRFWPPLADPANKSPEGSGAL